MMASLGNLKVSCRETTVILLMILASTVKDVPLKVVCSNGAVHLFHSREYCEREI